MGFNMVIYRAILARAPPPAYRTLVLLLMAV